MDLRLESQFLLQSLQSGLATWTERTELYTTSIFLLLRMCFFLQKGVHRLHSITDHQGYKLPSDAESDCVSVLTVLNEQSMTRPVYALFHAGQRGS